jgi:hypothetical protein
MRRRLAPIAVLSLLTACSVADPGNFKEIPQNEFPAGLRVTLPPTTTTTTTTTTIPGPTTTEVTTTLPAVPTEVIQVFYIQGLWARAVSLVESTPVTPQQRLNDLASRVGMISESLRLASVLPLGTDLVATSTRGVVTVELGSALESVLPEDLPLFFAQVVLTVLAPGRLGQVVFTQNGKPYPAVKSDQTVLDPGQPVAWEDYAELISGPVQPPVSTTTTTQFEAP